MKRVSPGADLITTVIEEGNMRLFDKTDFRAVLILCFIALIVLVSGCQKSSINGVIENSREYIQFTQFYVDKNFIHSDTTLEIVFRSKEDELTFFNQHPIKSRFPFPEINYEHNDVVGICLGRRDARGAYVTIDSVILNEQSEIFVYSTEYDYETEFPVKNYPIKFATIPKYELPVRVLTSNITIKIESKIDIPFEEKLCSYCIIKPDSLIAVVFHSQDEQQKFFDQYHSTIILKEIDYNNYDVVGICVGPALEYEFYLSIEEVCIINRSEIVVCYKRNYLWDGAWPRCGCFDYPQAFAMIPKYGFPVEFVEIN